MRSSEQLLLPAYAQTGVTPPHTLLRVAMVVGLSQQKWRGWREGPGVRKGQQGPQILILLWLEVGRKETQLKY